MSRCDCSRLWQAAQRGHRIREVGLRPLVISTWKYIDFVCPILTNDLSVIPEGNSVTIPTYALQRDPRYFGPLPDTFWPERWILAEESGKASDSDSLGNSRAKVLDDAPKTKITHNMAAFVPFSFGPANCVGMRLAMLEMRIVVALLVRNFDFAPAPGVGREDLDKYEGTIEDWFAASVGQLNVKLTPRFDKTGLRSMS